MTQTAVITGAHSQLARCMGVAETPVGWRAVFCPREKLDISDRAQAYSVLDQLAPACIVNTAAYTAVDRAESEAELAWRVNADGVANLAGWCVANDARLIHVSTDFVFDGRAGKPYLPMDSPEPLGEYGRGKLAGERATHKLAPGRGSIVRTSWLYSQFGHNFVKTMLKLMATRNELTVVDDQVGCPTSAHSLAALLWHMVQRGTRSRLYQWHDGGVMSWREFALEIQQCGRGTGILSSAVPIRPISGADYPSAAKRPAYSVMDRSLAMGEFEMPEREWRSELARVVGAIAERGFEP